MRKLIIFLLAGVFVFFSVSGAIAEQGRNRDQLKKESITSPEKEKRHDGEHRRDHTPREGGEIDLTVTVNPLAVKAGERIDILVSLENKTSLPDKVSVSIALMRREHEFEISSGDVRIGGSEVVEHQSTHRLPEFLKAGDYELVIEADSKRGGHDKEVILLTVLE